MIKVILSGGLGNQMFQYAAGKALSLRLNTQVSVDLYKLEKKSNAIRRNYQLNIFETLILLTSDRFHKIIVKSYKFTNNRIGKCLLKMMNVLSDYELSDYLDSVYKMSPETTLIGYFQNESYFKDFEFEIRKMYTFKPIPDERNKYVLELVQAVNSVSLHVRRGDYVNTDTNLVVLDTDYYRKAISYISERVDKPYIFIFSDDMDWVRENLDLQGLHHMYIDYNKGDNSYLDMQLMSQCKHNIIANSSFSWWGAWLNAYTDKIVTVPSRWYKLQSPGSYDTGFIPSEWTIIQ